MNLPQPRFKSDVFFQVAAAALVVVSIVCSGCSGAAPAGAEQSVPKVTVTPVKSVPHVDSDEYIGNTEAWKIVEVRSRVSGVLSEPKFQDGDFVFAGKTILFTIEPDEYEAIYQQSLSRVKLHEARRDLAEKTLARDEVLFKQGNRSKQEYDESVAALSEATAAIKAAEADAARTALDVKYTVIKAEIDGRIDRALVTGGNLVTGGLGPGTLLTKIVNEEWIYVYFDVDERSLLRYMRQQTDKLDSKPGNLSGQEIDCFVQLADEKDFLHKGQLDFAPTEVDKGTGTARIRGKLENKDRALASGMSVRVRIPVGKEHQALLIPEQALLTDQSIKYVYVVGTDGTATRRDVTLGTLRSDGRIILSGLNEGDPVIVKGHQRVRPGQKVEVEKEKPAPTATPAATPMASPPAAATPAAATPTAAKS